MAAGHVIGVDVGGTFTDAVALHGDSGELLAAFKLPSTPEDPGRAVLQAVARLAESLRVQDALVCHGTTIGTNTLIQRRGARTALVATEGFRDVIALRRQARPELYDFTIRITPALVPPALRFEAAERVDAGGAVLRPLAGVPELVATLQAAGVEAVAIALLHAYANPAHEQALDAALRQALPGAFITCSSTVCPEFREYERTSTTVVNAYVGPAVGRYVQALDAGLRQQGAARLMVVKSNGGLTSPANAALLPAHLIESGPAAGLAAAAAYARAAGRPNLIAFDMGGTTAKAGLIRDFAPEPAAEFYADRLQEGRDVGGHAIRSPILDVVEIGAGGGSLAWIDAGGVLKLGPQSAGADPGPACHGRGELPTVTDAHAVIGTISAETFAGTGLAFDRARAAAALQRHVAQPFGWPLARAAHAILDLAVAQMAAMMRLASVQRGVDPRDFAILASGGAGPLHAAAVAAEIGAREVLVPPYPGMFSALGATLGEVRHELVQSLLRPLAELTAAQIGAGFATLRRRAEALLAEEPPGAAAPQFDAAIEARFLGQMFELRLPAASHDPAVLEADFRARYRREYGFDLPQAAVQLVNLRLSANLPLRRDAAALFAATAAATQPASPRRHATLLARDGTTQQAAVHSGDSPGLVTGPALVDHAGATVWIQAGQQAVIAAGGHIRISLA